MAQEQTKVKNREVVWFLGYGCSNHMCGSRELLNELDEKFKQSVRLGNNTKIEVAGKINVKLKFNG